MGTDGHRQRRVGHFQDGHWGHGGRSQAVVSRKDRPLLTQDRARQGASKCHHQALLAPGDGEQMRGGE